MKRLVSTAALITSTFLVIDTANAGEPGWEQISCRSTREIMDATQPDMSKIRAIRGVIEQTFLDLDRANVARGRPPIYARMSESGKGSTKAVATVMCEKQPNKSLKQTVVEVYKGIEGIGDTLGVND